MADLTHHVALVTGGSRGIGKAIALALAEAGVAVAVNYRERGDEASAVADAIRRRGSRADAFGADVSQCSAVRHMVRDIETRLGPIDILVNNAGMAAVRTVDDITEEDFARTIAVNLTSAFLCTQAVLPGMRARRWGRVVRPIVSACPPVRVPGTPGQRLEDEEIERAAKEIGVEVDHVSPSARRSRGAAAPISPGRRARTVC
jgi:NAD(P)-dependent dehydrogenase (short-subunit alcohol dehydrogenase family)